MTELLSFKDFWTWCPGCDRMFKLPAYISHLQSVTDWVEKHGLEAS